MSFQIIQKKKKCQLTYDQKSSFKTILFIIIFFFSILKIIICMEIKIFRATMRNVQSENLAVTLGLCLLFRQSSSLLQTFQVSFEHTNIILYLDALVSFTWLRPFSTMKYLVSNTGHIRGIVTPACV